MSNQMNIEVGKRPPDFSLKDSEEKVCSLNDYLEKYLVLYFYPKDNTPGCTIEANGFKKHFKTFEELDTTIVGISPDNASSHKKFIQKFDLPFSLLSDPEKNMMSEYGAFGEKMMYGKKKMGVIRSTLLIGKNGKVIKHWKKVPKTSEHPLKVLEIIQKISN